MAGPNDGGDHPEIGPDQAYPPNPAQPQFPQAHYQFHATSEYPSLDQDMNMSDTYGQSVQQNIAGQLQDATANAPRNGDVNEISVNTNGATSAGMAPPQTPHQSSFSPAGGDTNVDETPDAGEAHMNPRKRSKVSRACDECRRKKVKCDAADLDGSIKTCTNCAKAGLTCEYVRVPMKRGPSKGYIKELSDRVQQVESLQAVLAGQPGYRQSLDAQSMGEGMYSPDDPMSLKRNFSFSDASRNPFAASEFQRDRIPSVGGAWTNSPTSAGFRPRERGSMALAPDQTLTPTSYPKPSPPYWAASSSEPPPAKRQKRNSDHVPSAKIESKHVDKYYEAIHHELPVLPDLDTTLNVAHAASPEFQLLLATSVSLIPASDKNEEPDAVERAASAFLSSGSQLWEKLSNYMREEPASRSAEDNLLLAWSCVLLAIHCEYKVKGILGGPGNQFRLIKEAVDLSRYLLGNDQISTSVDGATFTDLIQRLQNLTLVLAKHHALGSASADFVNVEYFLLDLEWVYRNLPTTVALTAACANTMSMAIIQVQNYLQSNDLSNIMNKTMVTQQLLLSLSTIPGIDKQSSSYRLASLFFELLLSRYQYIPLAAAVLAPAAQLAEELSQTADPAGTGPIVWKPLDIHLYTLTTITLLEVLAAVPDAGLLAIAEQALNTIQPVIERKVETYHIYKSGLEKSDKWYEGDEEGLGNELSWMEVLLKHIAERRKAGWTQPNPAGANGVGALVGPNNSMNVAFDTLLRTGYLKVLSGFA